MSKKPPIPICTFDFETDPFLKDRIPKPFAAGISFNGETTRILWGSKCVDSLLDIFHKIGCVGKFIAFAHNGGKFDFHFLLPGLIKRYGSANVSFFCVGSRIVQIKTPCFELRDSFAIIPRPLRDLGTAKDSKKEIEFWKLESEHREKYRVEIQHYLGHDCTALFKALELFRETYGKNSLTLASAASKYMAENYEIKIPRSNENFDNTFRPFYFGGRVEFFQLGEIAIDKKKPTKVLDINSAYPFAMLSPHFWSVDYRSSKTEPKKFADQSFYEIECHSKGAFPLRVKDTPIEWENDGRKFRAEKGAVCFPHGFFAFKVSGWELKAARELKLISREKITKVLIPTAVQDFPEYVKHFYALKASAGTDGEKAFAKLFLNGYYGKTAANPRKFREYRVSGYGEEIEGFRVDYENPDTNLSFHSKKADEKQIARGFKNVACGASVTGFVRAMLMRAINGCEKCFYCDTDSVIGQGTENLPVGLELGQWKVEADVVELHIAGKKLYALKHPKDKKGKSEKMASKGVCLTFDQIKKLAAGENQSYSFNAPSFSLKSAPRFTTRTVRRADKREKVKPIKNKKLVKKK